MSPLKWNWVQWLLGVDGGEVAADADVRLAWTRLPQSWRVFAVLLVVALCVYAVVWLYRQDASRIDPRRRKILAGLRIAVVVLLALVSLGPALAHTHRRVLQPMIVLLRDRSQSMAIADRLSDPALRAAAARIAGGNATPATHPPTRAALADRLFEVDRGALIQALEARGRIQLLDFAESVRTVELRRQTEEQSGDEAASDSANDSAASWSALPAAPAVGPGTNLHEALSEALAERTAAAVVLLTDGQHTDRGAGRDELLALAAQARDRKVPLLIVGLGDPTPPRNVHVTDVYADAQVWKDDPFELQSVLRSEGFGGQSVTVELVEQQLSGADGEDAPRSEILETREIVLPDDGGQLRLSFTHTPTAAGRYSYAVRVQPLEGESTIDDNQPAAPAEVKVIDDKARVLLVAGHAHWDYRFVRQLLEREKSIDLSCWLQTLDAGRAQEGDTPVTRLPRTREELYAYDVVLLLDPDPREFDDAWIGLLRGFVDEHAGGLLYMAGPMFASRFLSGPSTQEITSLLPVQFGDLAATNVGALLETNDREWSLGIVDAAVDHPLMRFHSEPNKSLAVWQELPGITWSFPVSDPLPAATVLLEHSDPALAQFSGPRPLLVTSFAGAGRTVFLGFDGTWRWRQTGHNAEFFNRFWLQTTRYLIEGRTVEGKRRGVVETDGTRYEIGDRILAAARLTDAQFKPLEVPEVAARLTIAGREPIAVTLRAVPRQPGRYEAALTAQQTGRHVLRVEFPDAGTSGAPVVETAFAVSPPSMETALTWQDEGLLRELATASGGRYFSIDTFASLPAAVPDRQETLLVQGKPIPLWDTSRVLLLVVGLLVAEWALRKKWKLL